VCTVYVLLEDFRVVYLFEIVFINSFNEAWGAFWFTVFSLKKNFRNIDLQKL